MMIGVEDDLIAFADRIRGARDFKHVMVCGMGGSSLCPEVLRQTFGKQDGYPGTARARLDRPGRLRRHRRADRHHEVPLHHLLEVGHDHRAADVLQVLVRPGRASVKENPGENFVAVTDPGTKMEADATRDKFRRIFLNPADIGGRYSALSYFGMVPAALMGLDIEKLLDRAERIVHACSQVVPAAREPRRAARRHHRRVREGGPRQADHRRRPEDRLVRAVGRAAARREHGQGGQGHRARRGRAAGRARRSTATTGSSSPSPSASPTARPSRSSRRSKPPATRSSTAR